MLGSAFWLTLATLLGLCLGFAREWLLVASWGAGERSDAFLIALFLPEALRMSLAGGVLSAAALPLFLERQGERRLDWLAAILPALLGIAVALSLLLLAAAPWLVRLLGPGLAETASAQAAANLRVLAWCVPGLMLHALFSIPLQAAERFVLAGLGSLLFNLPPVLYLALHGQASQPEQLALACLLGSLLMPLVLLPSLWIEGWRPWHWRLSGVELGELGGRIAPLLLSNAASQGLALVERDADGVELLCEATQDGAHLARLRFRDAPARWLSGEVTEQVLDEAALACAAYLVGLMDGAFERTLEYLKVRRQFGREIGSFQALQHRMVDLRIQIELSRAMVEQAAAAIDAGASESERQRQVSSARVRASEAALLVTRQAIQLHGGIGYTDEADIGLFLRRAMVLLNAHGSLAFHKARYAALLQREVA